MSQRKEKYARSLGRRMDKLEDRTGRLEKSRDRTGKRLGEYSKRLTMIEADIACHQAIYDNELEVRRSSELHAVKENRRNMREIERGVVVALLLDVLLAVVILIVAVNVG